MSQKYDSLSDIWKLKRRGKRDSERHKELVKRAIRKHGRDLITEYNIIRSDGDKKVKVPIRFLDRYRFKYGKLNDNQQVGQGLPGKKGTKYKIGQGQPQKGSGNEPGNEEGERVYDAEVSIDEVVAILMEELDLPWMEPKGATKIETELEEFSSIEKKGLMPNLDIKRTLVQNLIRNAAKGEAKVGNFHRDDFRFKQWETTKEYHSNAAIYLMMDRSGSMGEEKTHIAKSFFFWMVQFLKRRYKNVDIVFIAHDSTAWIETEEKFFAINSSGGTQCSSAFKLAYEHMSSHHPPDRWNNYLIEFSDGDNWGNDNQICLDYVQKLLPMCRAIGYGEIIPKGEKDAPWFSNRERLSDILEKNIKRTRYVTLRLEERDDVFDALKRFFNIDNISSKEKRKPLRKKLKKK
jgi:sporulation protein YhbH